MDDLGYKDKIVIKCAKKSSEYVSMKFMSQTAHGIKKYMYFIYINIYHIYKYIQT